MNNPEDLPKVEQGSEHIPTREDVLAEIKKWCEKGEVVKELSDERGVYILEIIEPGEKSGESTLYAYQRAGTFGKNSAVATVIEKVYLVDDIPVGGDIIAEHNDATGEWIEK